MNNSSNPLKEKSYQFAIRIVNLYKYLIEEKKEYVLAKQVLRSGTAIGALVRESQYAESKADFVHKLSIALKETNETDYWLCLLKDAEFLSENAFLSIQQDCEEPLKLLTASIKTAKTNSKTK
ncbi:MAG: four helix bundle protein [Microscillaceae bacterium]|jgi:four helix bundle protein|nr:four helix bundle protein [Microscillaceae bacterium]